MFLEEIEVSLLSRSNFNGMEKAITPIGRRRLSVKGRGSPFSIFNLLKIPYKRVHRKTFWIVNEDQLEYLYQDLCKYSRQKLAELHPDNNPGREEESSLEFIDFKRQLDLVRRGFNRRGYGKNILNDLLDKEKEWLESLKERITKKKLLTYSKVKGIPFLNPSRKEKMIPRIAPLIQQGVPFVVIAKEVGIHRITVAKYSKGVIPYPEKCRCGNNYLHTGPCLTSIHTNFYW